jgi:hypothetical protein
MGAADWSRLDICHRLNLKSGVNNSLKSHPWQHDSQNRVSGIAGTVHIFKPPALPEVFDFM